MSSTKVDFFIRTKEDSFIPPLSSTFVEPGIVVNTQKKPRNKQVCYTLSETFASKEIAEEYVKKESCWSTARLTSTEDGEKRFYRCNKVKARGLQCATSIYLLFDCASAQVLLFRCDMPHNCDIIGNRAISKLTAEVQLLIEQMCDEKKKPLAIMDQIVLRKLPLPKMYQINNHLTSYKKKKFGATTISITYLSELLKEFTKNPESVDSPYVVHDLSSDNKYFRFFMTSTALIEKARGAHSLQADATYKLMWQGFPVLIVGTTDLDRKFHLIGVAVCVCENKKILNLYSIRLRSALESFFSVTLLPLQLFAMQRMPSVTRSRLSLGLKVPAHMLRKVKQKLKTLIKEKEIIDMVIKDIVSMQVISSPHNFEIARSLF